LNPRLKKDNDQGNVWSCKTILQLWEFSHEMWEHCNTILHDHQIESSRQIHDAQINDKITKLCKNIDSYNVSDRWYFDLPLALHLRKPLCTRWRWLWNAKILVHKSPNWAMLGQMMLMTYYKYLNAPWHVVNHSLWPPIQAAQNFIQTTLFRWRPLDPD
jgi:hypothetical protein